MWTGQEIAKPNPTQPPLTCTIDPDADRIADVMNNPAKIGPKKLLSLLGKMWSAAAIADMGGGIPAAEIPWAHVCTKAAFALCLNKESRFSGAFLGVAKKKDEFKISGSSAPRLLICSSEYMLIGRSNSKRHLKSSRLLVQRWPTGSSLMYDNPCPCFLLI